MDALERRTEKSVPYDIDAEQAVLGSLLIDPDAIVTVGGLLDPVDFYREEHGWIYTACLALNDRNEAVNQITVAHELSVSGRLSDCGGVAYLSQLVSMVPTSLHAEYYAQIVQRTSTMRRLIRVAGQIAAIGYEGAADVDASLARAEELVFSVRGKRHARDFVHIRDILDRFYEDSQFAHDQQSGDIPHILTGFVEVDKLLGGFQRSDLIILAARPSLGKSSLALNIGHYSALHQGATIAVFSLEMSKEQLVHRLISSEAGIESQRLRLPELSGDRAWERVQEAIGTLSELNIYIDDSPLSRITELRSKARRLHNEHPIDLIIIDYLQLIQGSGRTDNRVNEISEISRSLKALARELNAPVLALSQLSRAVETRSPHTPMLSDLRESGSIEQDADVVMFIYRDDVYYDEEEWMRHNPTEPYPKGIAEIIIAKHRNGPTGKASLLFFEKQTKFANLALRPVDYE